VNDFPSHSQAENKINANIMKNIKRGFTLIDLLAVVALVGILTSMIYDLFS
jgi:prepilin-type N-terminal cleavage/methylation domain-containing protein